jgi:hypothetical protein
VAPLRSASAINKTGCNSETNIGNHNSSINMDTMEKVEENNDPPEKNDFNMVSHEESRSRKKTISGYDDKMKTLESTPQVEDKYMSK